MQNISFKVKEIHQMGGDHVIGFTADVQLMPGTTAVEVVVVSIDNQEADPAERDATEAVGYIRQGMEEALASRGLGAYVIISNLTMHATDFVPHKHKRYAKQYLEAELSRREEVADN